MTQKTTKPKAWFYILIWFVYIALMTLYGEYIVSRPVDIWIQAICTLAVLLVTFYIFKFTLSPLFKNKP